MQILKNIDFCSICPLVPLSFHMEQLVSHLTDFNEILYLIIFLKFVKKIQDSFNLTRINEFQFALLSYRSQFYYYENVSNRSCRENRKNIIYIQQLFKKKKTIVFERTRLNIVDSDGPQIVVWCMYITR